MMKAFIYTVYWTLITWGSCPPSADEFGRKPNTLFCTTCKQLEAHSKQFTKRDEAMSFVRRAANESDIEGVRVDSFCCSVNLSNIEIRSDIRIKPIFSNFSDTL